MKFSISVLFALLCSIPGFSQIRMDKLVIHSKDTFKILGSDIIVVDTLVMENSSTIVLNGEKEDNFIHAKVMTVGSNCSIIGDGTNGTDGVKGLPGYTAVGPCKDGISGRNGTSGTPAASGVNLYIYFTQLTIKDKLSFELSGGDGGDGGRGGIGGGGSPGTRLCQGGNGGSGGNGGHGGNGGNGGNLTFSCKICPDLRLNLTDKITVRSYRGNGGLGGDGGLGGLAGLVSSGNDSADGDQGTRGKTGDNGKDGKNGAINFEQN